MGHVPKQDMASPRIVTHARLPITTKAHSFMCRALATSQLYCRDWFPGSSMASPGRMGAPNRAADGTVLLKMNGDLGLKLRMELSAKH